MISEDVTMQALRKEVSALTLRLKELGEENRDLREICNERGIHYAELLAARRHKRHFADLCEKHPIGTTANASDLLGAAPAVRGIAACAGSVLRTGLIARCFFAAFTDLTVQLPWRFGGRLSATFEGHTSKCFLWQCWRAAGWPVVLLIRRIKTWDLATGACMATLEGHEQSVWSFAVLQGGCLASGSIDQTPKI